MRTLIISDIHANLTALKAVLEAAEPFDRVWCLGDVVGYGPDPNECIEVLRDLPNLACIKGNHDAAILREIDIITFNFEARASLVWLDGVLKPENLKWLRSNPERLVFDDVTIVHGSPRNPVWEYVMDLGTARENMSDFDTRICLVGHTHIPGVYQMEGETQETTKNRRIANGKAFKISGTKAIINPGSVGQPRDHNPRASYLIYDDDGDEWHFHRVAYDFEAVQERIRAAGLPERHANRLKDGW